ncbi:MAG TPA: VWA domain-containing protein [Thermoanaerobaculia bacterium]|nr:VWA domain-containing protein [Thermoanaerobaculia bacterium]
MEFLVGGEVVEWQSSAPFLLLLNVDEARSGVVVEARARFEDGETAEGALVVGSPGRLAEQVDVRILELPFQLRRRDRSRSELTAADLIVSLVSQDGSGGAERSPEALLLEESLPLRTQLLIDVSGTMLEERESLGLALDRFARSLKPDDEIGLVEFRETARVVLPMSADELPLVAAFETLSAGGGTALLDAIATAVAAMPATVGRRAVVLLSDGIDEHSTLGVADVDGLLRRARVALYVIHVESDSLARDPIRARARIRHLSSIRGFLETRARGSGGHYCFATDQAAIEDCLAEVVEDLRRTHLAVIHLRSGEDGSGATLKLRPGIPGRLMIR